MKQYKIVEKKDLEVDDVICDSCGKSCYNGTNFEFIELVNHWGYGSKHDMETWEAQICEECADTKLNFINFKKYPTRIM